MITLQSADNALKSFYLDAVAETLNHKVSPFFAQVKSSTANVWGKDVRKAVKYGLHSGVGAGTETGDLPEGHDGSYVQFVAPLKNLYGTIEISDKAIRASGSDEGAFVNLLNDEMESLVKSASFQFNRMLFGDGNGMLAYFDSILSGNEITVTTTVNLFKGMKIYFFSNSMELKDTIGCRTIVKVDRENNKIYVDGDDISVTHNDYWSGYISLNKEKAMELTGLEGIFNNAELYGVKKSEYDFMKPVFKNSVGDISENLIQKTIDEVEERSGGTVNFIVCSWGVRRALVEYYKARGIAMPTVEIEGGFKSLSFNGIPVVADRFCPAGVMYLLNTDDFKLYQLCDWQWMEGDDGKILRQVPGKPVYTATLVKYAELICERPGAQAKLAGITEA